MKNNLYLFSNTIIRRKENSILLEKIRRESEEDDEFLNEEETFLGSENFIPSGEKKRAPIESIGAVYAIGSINFNSHFLRYISKYSIPLHLFSYSGNYFGSFFPLKRNLSGTILLNQTRCHLNGTERLFIAKKIIDAAIGCSLANLKYYNNRGANIKDQIEHIEDLREYAGNAESIEELMGIEGNAKRIYYSAWKHIFVYPVDFNCRIKNPPNNLINALISYGNAIVYSVCLNEIYLTRLYPEIGFIHQPGDNKTCLVYDIAEIFKPIITDRAIFKAINKNILSENEAFRKGGACLLKKNAKQKFVEIIDVKLSTTIQLEGKEAKYSYRRIIREECYKLIKHFNGEEKYNPFIAKWR